LQIVPAEGVTIKKVLGTKRKLVSTAKKDTKTVKKEESDDSSDEHPEEAVKDADFIVTDTWISMGWEQETERRLRDFAGFRVTEELAKRGGARADWKLLHCLPRHQDEVSDEVFYGPRSQVFQEAENRVWSAAAVLEEYVVQALQGEIL